MEVGFKVDGVKSYCSAPDAQPMAGELAGRGESEHRSGGQAEELPGFGCGQHAAHFHHPPQMLLNKAPTMARTSTTPKGRMM